MIFGIQNDILPDQKEIHFYITKTKKKKTLFSIISYKLKI